MILKLAIQKVYKELEEVLGEIGELKLQKGNPYLVEISVDLKHIRVEVEIGGVKEKGLLVEKRKIKISGFKTWLEAYGFASYLWKSLIQDTGEIWYLKDNLQKLKNLV